LVSSKRILKNGSIVLLREAEMINMKYSKNIPHLHNTVYCCMLVMLSIFICINTAESAENISFPEVISNYEIHETIVSMKPNLSVNPFVEAQLTGEYVGPNGIGIKVDGFCDSPDGSIFKIRFTPKKEGAYVFNLVLTYAGKQIEASGKFDVISGEHDGFVSIDPHDEKRLMTSNASKPYFLSKTAWLLMGSSQWKEFIDLAVSYNINVLRFGLEVNYYYNSAHLDVWPWEGTRSNPDYSRFNVAVWQRFDDIFRYAYKHNIYLEPVIFTSVRRNIGSYKYNFIKDRDMELYWQYMVARLSSYSNIVFFQLFNEFGRNKTYQTYMAEFIQKLDPYDHLISSSTGTTEGAFWPDLEWNKLAINHSCTSSDPVKHGLKNYYYMIGKKVSSYNKPGWIDETGRLRHNNTDPVYRRKEYWIWSMADVYFNYHSQGGCENIDKLEIGPAEEFVRYLRPFWEKETQWWSMRPDDTIVFSHEGIDFAFAKSRTDTEEVVIYLVNEKSDKWAGKSKLELKLNPSNYNIRLFDPSTGLFYKTTFKLSVVDTTNTIKLDLPAFKDDMLVHIKKSS